MCLQEGLSSFHSVSCHWGYPRTLGSVFCCCRNTLFRSWRWLAAAGGGHQTGQTALRSDLFCGLCRHWFIDSGISLDDEIRWTPRQVLEHSGHLYLTIYAQFIFRNRWPTIQSSYILLPFLTLFASMYHVPTVSIHIPSIFHSTIWSQNVCQMNLCPWTCCLSRWEWLGVG